MRTAPTALLATLAVLAFAGAGCLGGLGGSGRTEWAYDDAQLDAVAAQGRTGAGVTVAFLDTGIDVRHPSLDHLRDGDRADGELVAFRDFLGSAQGAEDAFDDDGHGTHVAGILAARGSSRTDKLGGIDLRGGAPSVLLVVGRVCSADACDPTILPLAIDWAVAQGADVVSLSLGGQFGLRDLLQERAIEASVARAVDAGVVVIASAGNKGPDNTDVESPSQLPDVIAVGAVDRRGQVAAFSSRGDDAGNPCSSLLPLPGPLGGRCYPDQKPEIVAPGVDILSTWAGNAEGSPCAGEDYCVASGTSQATPFVTAAVALMLEGKGDLPGRAAVERVKQVLVDTAAPVEGQALPHDEAAGYGRLQAEAAIVAYG
jgi:subtilisin family serine protease